VLETDYKVTSARKNGGEV